MHLPTDDPILSETLFTKCWPTMPRAPIFGPDFMCIGMPKAGTGWLFDQLKYHPDFWMPPVKEFGYLKREQSRPKKNAIKRLRGLQKGTNNKLASWANRRTGDARDIAFLEAANASMGNPMDVARYAALFQYKEYALSGDITPGYASLDPAVIREVGQVLPDLKLVLLVRDPIDRAWSRLSMWARQGTFDVSVLANPKDFRSFLETKEKLTCESFPTDVVRRWKENAPKLEMRCFLFDDLAADSNAVRRDMLIYLGADPRKEYAVEASRNRKAGRTTRLEMSDASRTILVEFFRQEILECAVLFGGAARTWPTRYGI